MDGLGSRAPRLAIALGSRSANGVRRATNHDPLECRHFGSVRASADKCATLIGVMDGDYMESRLYRLASRDGRFLIDAP